MNPLNNLNFSAGPGALPESVLLEVQQSILEVPGVGLSILGISHRSDWFESVVAELENNIRKLLGLDANYHVLFLQGGTTQQFSMIPMTLLRGKAAPAEYLHTGYWSGKAITEARREGTIRELWSGEAGGYRRLPGDEELVFSPDAAYLHYISNETVEGLQFHRVLGRDDVPRVCDMSSDFPVATLRGKPLCADLCACTKEHRPGRRHGCADSRRSSSRTHPPTYPAFWITATTSSRIPITTPRPCLRSTSCC